MLLIFREPGRGHIPHYTSRLYSDLVLIENYYPGILVDAIVTPVELFERKITTKYIRHVGEAFNQRRLNDLFSEKNNNYK